MFDRFLVVPAQRMSKAERKRICVAAAKVKVYLALHGEAILVPRKIGEAKAEAYARRITELNDIVIL